MNKLEEYVLNITEPFDFSGNLELENNNGMDIVVELIEKSENENDEWNPKLPEHASGNQHLNVGLDFFSAVNVESTEVTPSYHFAVVRTGVKMELPYSYHMMIASRSGLGFKQHIEAFPGIIDHSYRGEIMIKLHSPIPFFIEAGSKIAQGLIFNSLPYMLKEGVVDTNTERGDKGFGSTDKSEG